jgi:rhodanese-related sulfurtransferase
MALARWRQGAAAAFLIGALGVASHGHAQDTCTPPADQAAADPTAALAAVVPVGKRTKANLYLTAKDAGPMLAEHAKEVLFVDVRTRTELMFIGMPVAADAHVPFWLDAGPGSFDAERGAFVLKVNPDFVAAIDRRLAAKGLTRNDPVVLMCQAGGRAARAANALTEAGFAQPWIIVDGFEGDPAVEGPTKGLRTVNGWRNAGLPWTARLDRSKMYGLQ